MLLNRDELNELMDKINLDQFKEEVKLKNETRGRKPVDIVNHWFYPLSEVRDYSDLQGWVDDVLTGAGRLATDDTVVSPMMIFHLLKSLPYITTSEIKSHLNRSRAILTGDVITNDSYCRKLRNKVYSAIKSLDYHTEQGKKLMKDKDDLFNFPADSHNWNEEKKLLDKNNCYPQTNAELVAKLRKAGLTEDKITDYLLKRNLSNTTSEIN